MYADITRTIIHFSSHLAPAGTVLTAREKAITFGWLCEDGLPTPEGQELAESLKGQGGTRSVFRQVA